jgi:xanthine dehydrogenase accessory factor
MSLYDVPATDAGARVVAVARVTSAVGLGARWPGQVAWVRDDGSVVGSLLGGAFDTGLVADVPAALPRSARSAGGLVIDLEFDHDAAQRVGLPCGGAASVLVQPLSSIPPDVQADLAARRPTALVTSLDGDAFTTRGLKDEEDPTYHDEASPDSVARVLLARGEPSDALVETGEGQVLVSVVVPTPHLVVIGSGALAVALDAQLSLLGWTCASLAQAEDGVAAVRALGPGDGVLVIDHRGEVDLPILSAALAGPVCYVAALGSRRTQEARRDRLRGAGVDDETIARLRGPAGLDIGSRTPAEIAVAIVAEMLSVRGSAAGGALRDRGGPINASRS